MIWWIQCWWMLIHWFFGGNRLLKKIKPDKNRCEQSNRFCVLHKKTIFWALALYLLRNRRVVFYLRKFAFPNNIFSFNRSLSYACANSKHSKQANISLEEKMFSRIQIARKKDFETSNIGKNQSDTLSGCETSHYDL